jgi:phenylacetate-CoA ligase
MGRADQATKVRGMFVHPKQVAKVTDKFPEIFKARIEVSTSDGHDEFKFLCESSDHSEMFNSKVEEAIRAECRLRSEVVFVETKSLPNDGKVIDDKRIAGC